MSHRRTDKGSITPAEYEIILQHLKHYRDGPVIASSDKLQKIIIEVKRAYCECTITPIVDKMEARMKKYPNSFCA
jgi:hypothetical protein